MRARPFGLTLLPTPLAAPQADALASSLSLGTLTADSDESGAQVVLACVDSNVLVDGSNPPGGALSCEGGAGTLGRFVVNGKGDAEAAGNRFRGRARIALPR